MEGQNYLGIYIGRNTATVVCLGSHGRDGRVRGCFSVSVPQGEDGSDEPAMGELARLVSQGCIERELEFADVGVAVNCSMFMQHNVHSDFSDAKQIAQTVRFDTEEALSTDITDVAVAFKIVSSNESGSELTVFTAERKALSDIVLSLQSNSIDPISMEPDVSCLSRFVLRKVSLPHDSQSLFAILSGRSGYFMQVTKSREIPTQRTILINSRQNRADLLTREARITTALASGSEPIERVQVFDAADSVDCEQLGAALGIESGAVELTESVSTDPDVLVDYGEPVDFAIAYGAALAQLDKGEVVDFRADFMPYQGKKMRLQKTLKFMSVSVCVLLVALGVYFTSQLVRVNSDRRKLRSKFEADYIAVMPGSTRLPTYAVKKLGTELRQVKKGGLVSAEGERSVLAKLAMILGAFNYKETAAKTGLNITEINIVSNMTIVGDTASRNKTRVLRTAIRKNKMNITKESGRDEKGRHKFNMTLKPID